MSEGLEDARKLAHGTYDDVIVVEHRRPTSTSASRAAAVHVVLELPERSRVVDTASVYTIDGFESQAAPAVGGSYRLIVGQTAEQALHGDAAPGSVLRYETRTR